MQQKENNVESKKVKGKQITTRDLQRFSLNEVAYSSP